MTHERKAALNLEFKECLRSHSGTKGLLSPRKEMHAGDEPHGALGDLRRSHGWRTAVCVLLEDTGVTHRDTEEVEMVVRRV